MIPAPAFWRGDRSVRDWLFDQPWQFEFFQAVRILEALAPGRIPPGEGGSPDQEAVRLHSRVSLEFPASEVHQLDPPTDSGSPPDLYVNLMSLAGLHGPLPLPDTERVLERVGRRDLAMRDFLDVFHHRLLSLLVRIHKAHFPSLTARSPDSGAEARYLYSFIGLGLPKLRDRLAVEDRSLLHYAGILAQQPRPASGLERFFTDFFQVQTKVIQLIGQWRDLDVGERTLAGRSGQNQVLGQSAVLGTRYWDQMAGIEIKLGPMDLPAFIDFLPIGTAYQTICELTRFYLGHGFAFRFRLALRAAQVPESRLLGQAWLGWTSFLKTKDVVVDDSRVCISGV